MKLELIQCLRGVAALMVVFFHFSIFLEPLVPGSVGFFAGGNLGVDIFFIISGLIIYLSTESVAARSGAIFLTRRMCRVVIPAWCAMFISVLVMPPLLKDLLFGVFFIPLKNAGPPTFGYSFLIVAWTLTYELVFYGIFALVLSSATGRKHRGLATAGALLAVVAVVQSLTSTFALDAQAGPVVEIATTYFPVQLISLMGNPILLEFVVGIFLGWAYLSGYFDRVPLSAVTVVAALLAFLILKFQFRLGHGPSCGGLLATVLVAYVLILQVAWNRLHQNGMPRIYERLIWPVVFAGEISYSLYLVHPSVKAFLAKQTAVSGKLGAFTNWNFALALSVTFLLSMVFYRYVELPAQRFGRRITSRPNTMATVPGVGRA